MRIYRTFISLIVLIILAIACKKEIPNPDPWQNTFTPVLENNSQRDTVYDDETLTFSTDNTPSDRYIWSWGDGIDTTTVHYANHRFLQPGFYTVKLRVERGNTYGENTYDIWVKHRDLPLCGFKIDSEDSLYVQNNEHFVANITTPDCDVFCNFEYQWDFGDGHTAEGYHVTHAFSNAGIYTVKVNISRCSVGSDKLVQKQVVVGGNASTNAYECLCTSNTGASSFLDTLQIDNLPYNPIKVDDKILRRGPQYYFGEYNCNPGGCDTYQLYVYNQADSIVYNKIIMPFFTYTCAGRRL